MSTPAARATAASTRKIPSAALLVVGLTLAACGGDPADPADVPGVGEVRAGSVAQLADCADWQAASVDERLATIDDVRSQINLEDAPVEGPALSDEQAYELFQDACAEDYASTFRLYKLYARGAAFQSLAP